MGSREISITSEPTRCHDTAPLTKLDRYEGALLRLAAGDALGTTVEFSPRGTFKAMTDKVGGGPFRLKPGEWTDDTSMALCLTASLIHVKGFDARDQMNRYCKWRDSGYLGSTGACFDIGITVSVALSSYLATGDPFAGSPNPWTAGNGALMRLAPIPMMYCAQGCETWFYAGESTRTTHGAQEAIECSQLLRAALTGASKEAVMGTQPLAPVSAKVRALADGKYRQQKSPRGDSRNRLLRRIPGGCLVVLCPVVIVRSSRTARGQPGRRRGHHRTTAAICGQLAEAFYGAQSIPLAWQRKLVMADRISLMAHELWTLSAKR